MARRPGLKGLAIGLAGGGAVVIAAVLAVLSWPAPPMPGAGGPVFRGEMQAFRPAPVAATELTATDGEGKPIRLANLRGKVVLINFWATWCAPCVRELPALARLKERLAGEDFVLLALSSDRGGGRVVEPFLKDLGLADFPIQLDDGGADMRAYGLRGLPTTVLIDRDGREAGRIEGPADWSSAPALALIRYYLNPTKRGG